jgi:hypothetical protein
MNDGTIREYDVEPMIKKGGVFAQLADPEIFSDRITVLNGTVAWDMVGNRDPSRCVDIDPVTIQQQQRVSEPVTN